MNNPYIYIYPYILYTLYIYIYYTYIDPSIDPLHIQKNTTAISGNPRGPQLSAEPKPELLPGGADRPTWEKLVIPKIF